MAAGQLTKLGSKERWLPCSSACLLAPPARASAFVLARPRPPRSRPLRPPARVFVCPLARSPVPSSRSLPRVLPLVPSFRSRLSVRSSVRSPARPPGRLSFQMFWWTARRARERIVAGRSQVCPYYLSGLDGEGTGAYLGHGHGLQLEEHELSILLIERPLKFCRIGTLAKVSSSCRDGVVLHCTL